MTVSGSRNAYWVVFFGLLWFAVATEPNEDQECECPASVPLISDPPDEEDYPIFIAFTGTTITYMDDYIVWLNGHMNDCEEPIAETCIPPCICICTVLETRWTPGNDMVTCWETDAECKEGANT